MTRRAGGISLLSLIGIHPAAAAGVLAIDWMLFGALVGTLGVVLLVSIPVGIVLAIAVTLIQHRGSPQDDHLPERRNLVWPPEKESSSGLLRRYRRRYRPRPLLDWVQRAQSKYSATGRGAHKERIRSAALDDATANTRRYPFRPPAAGDAGVNTGGPFPARHPGWGVVQHSRWQGAASSALVSRSRAMPVGDRRSAVARA